jgi:hypothetical protein
MLHGTCKCLYDTWNVSSSAWNIYVMVMKVMMVMTFVQCFELLTQYLDFMEVLHVHALCISVHKMVRTNFVLKVSKEKLHSMVKDGTL